MSGALCWVDPASLAHSLDPPQTRDPTAAEIAAYLLARPEVRLDVVALLDRADTDDFRARWKAEHPGEEPSCKGIGGHPCIAWAREGACPHVPQALWRNQ